MLETYLNFESNIRSKIVKQIHCKLQEISPTVVNQNDTVSHSTANNVILTIIFFKPI